jgi:hypothetical protein
LKSKFLIASLIAILLFSALNLALAETECPTCHGTGKITCPTCHGTGKITTSETTETCPTCQGSGVITPTISNKGTTAWLGDGAVFIKGMFQNEEDIEAHAAATAEVEAPTKTYTNASTTKYDFPPHETVDVIISIALEDSDYRYLSSQRYLRTVRIYLSEVDEITCPDCGGTGLVSVAADCPECGGTGYITCPTCGGSGFLIAGGGQTESAGFPLVEVAAVAVGVAAAIAVAMVVVKKKRVSEASLRKLTASEFQNWVMQRLSGRAASQEDSRLGIDAYTTDGYPIQIKQSDDIGGVAIDNFATAMGRRKARNGIIVAFSFGTGVYEGTARAKIHYRLDIKTVTVKELIERRELISI